MKTPKDITYSTDRDYALSLNARSILPSTSALDFIQPLAIAMPKGGFAHFRVLLENMTRAVTKKPISVWMLFIVILGIAMAGQMIYQGVIDPYIKASQDYDFKLRTNNLAPTDKPPSLFPSGGGGGGFNPLGGLFPQIGGK